jgi:PhnB protein
MSVNPYLGFAGNCEEAFNLYAKVLKGKFLALVRGTDTPMADQIPEESKNKIMHVRLEIDGSILMGGDAPSQYYQPMAGNHVNINAKTPEEADRIWAELSAGGQVQMPIGETFWAKRFGTFTDKFGISWMINCEKPMQ